MRVAVIGGGASGMVAAITAAKNGAEVMLFERQSRVGKKLLSTGNGRCNLSNINLSSDKYHGADADFVTPAIEGLDVKKTLEFFRRNGLLTVTEPSGRIYPLSDQAGSVVDVLRFAVAQSGVTTYTDCEVASVIKTDVGFALNTATGVFTADSVIVACGGQAGSKVGGCDLGYKLLCSFGHSKTAIYPSLVQLRSDSRAVRSLKGIRADAGVDLLCGSSVVKRSEGEVQFTDYGISGPAIFEVSRWASVIGKNISVRLDLLKDLTVDETKALIEARIKSLPNQPIENLLVGTVHNRLGRTLIRCIGLDLTAPISSITGDDIDRIVSAVKSFSLNITGTMDFASAQVTAGGISCKEFYADTMESRLQNGLYAAGEVLDVDGDCGGYNLQWAFSSGYLAGKNAAKTR